MFPEVYIEAFWEGSFYSKPKDKECLTVSEIIFQVEIIDGLPFEPLESVIHFKRKMNREKDQKDLLQIESWKKQQEIS